MATVASAEVKELSEAELIAIEVEKMTTRNQAAQKEIDDALAKGLPPKEMQVDNKAMTEAGKRMQAAMYLQHGLHGTTIKNIIEFRPKNYMVDLHKIINLYSGSHVIKIELDEKSGRVIIIIPPQAV